MIEEFLQKSAKMVDESIPKFLPITPPDELYKAMRHLLDAGGKDFGLLHCCLRRKRSEERWKTCSLRRWL